MLLPKFTKFGCLPPREEPYGLTLNEIEQHFGRSNHVRRNVYDGLSKGCLNLISAGVSQIVVGGSFITDKPCPGDIAWWYNPQIDWSILDTVFQQSEKRFARGKYLIDHKIDGLIDCAYQDTHEYFLRTNTRLPEAQQAVGIIQIIVGDSL